MGPIPGILLLNRTIDKELRIIFVKKKVPEHILTNFTECGKQYLYTNIFFPHISIILHNET